MKHLQNVKNSLSFTLKKREKIINYNIASLEIFGCH